MLKNVLYCYTVGRPGLKSLNNLAIQLRKNCNHPELLESAFDSQVWIQHCNFWELILFIAEFVIIFYVLAVESRFEVSSDALAVIYIKYILFNIEFCSFPSKCLNFFIGCWCLCCKLYISSSVFNPMMKLTTVTIDWL